MTEFFSKSRSLDELEHQRARLVPFPPLLPIPPLQPFQPVDLSNIRVIQRREHLRFALESREPVWVRGKRRRQDLQRDIAIERRIARTIDLAHPARAEGADDFIRTEMRSDR